MSENESDGNADRSRYTFRLAAEDDIPSIVGLVNLAYRVEDFFKYGDRTDAAEVRDTLLKHQFIIVEDGGGAMAGCVEVRVDGERGYFGMLSVDPERQKTGLGAALITRAERFAAERGCTVMELTYVNVREELPAYYERYGYERTGTAPWERDEKTRFPVHFVTMSKLLGQGSQAVETRTS